MGACLLWAGSNPDLGMGLGTESLVLTSIDIGERLLGSACCMYENQNGRPDG